MKSCFKREISFILDMSSGRCLLEIQVKRLSVKLVYQFGAQGEVKTGNANLGVKAT